MFRNREEAALQLAARLKGMRLRDPLVLVASRAGAITGQALAASLGADFNFVMVRHLRAPGNPNLSVGAIAETGDVFLNHHARKFQASPTWFEHLKNEREIRLGEIQQLAGRTHNVRAPAHVWGRSVIVTDDGITTGARMIVALKAVRSECPFELIVAVPVIPEGVVEKISELCDQTVFLSVPENLDRVANHYEEKLPIIDDDRLCEILQRDTKRRKNEKAIDKHLSPASS